MGLICLISSIWSGTLILIWGMRGQSISAVNLAWFAVSIAGLVYTQGWIH
jgi:hypothetical protein